MPMINPGDTGHSRARLRIENCFRNDQRYSEPLQPRWHCPAPGQTKIAYLSGAGAHSKLQSDQITLGNPKSPRLLLFAAVGGLPVRLRPSSLSIRTKMSDDAKLKGCMPPDPKGKRRQV